MVIAFFGLTRLLNRQLGGTFASFTPQEDIDPEAQRVFGPLESSQLALRTAKRAPATALDARVAGVRRSEIPP